MASTYTIGTAEGVIRITYDPEGVAKAKKDQEELGATSLKTGSEMSKSSKVMAVAGLAVAAGIGVAVKQASDFQSKMTLLVTAGNESQAALGSVSKGIESIAIDTGTSLDQLADGMYIVEKAGKHGAAGLDVLKAAAEGARAEGTDLATMTTGLTSIMQSYAGTMKDPVQATNELVSASGMAKTTMQEFVASLPTVLPLASAVGISFAQVGGAIATLTQHGTSAREATQELNNTIRALVAPNQVASKAMQQLGINVTDLEKNVGKRGLTGSIQMVVEAIGKHLGPAGTVLVSSFMQSKSAGEDLQQMLASMAPDVRTLSQQYLDGKFTAAEYSKSLSGMGVAAVAQGSQFKTLAKNANGFNTLLRSGSPAAQTMTAALKQIMGGATGMNTALQLSGESAGYFNTAVDDINKSAAKSGKDISTWSKTQANAATQMGRLKASGEVLAVNLGTQLLPAVIGLTKALTGIVSWFASLGSGWQKLIVTALGLVAGLLLIASTFKKIQEAAAALKALALFLQLDVIWTRLMAIAENAWAVAQWILNAAMDANPVGLIVLAIIALIAIIIVVIKYHKQLGKFFTMIWGHIWDFMKMIGAWFAGPFVNFFKNIGKDIASFFKPVWDFFKSIGAWFAGPFVNFFVAAWHDILAAFDAAKSAVMTVVHVIVGIFMGIWHGIQAAVAPFVPLIRAVFGLIGAIIRLVMAVIWSVISLALHAILVVFHTVLNAIMAVWNAVWGAIKTAATAVWSFIVSAVTTYINMVKAVVTTVMNALKSAWDAVWGAIKDVVMKFWNWIHPYVSAAIGAVSSKIKSVLNTIKAVWNSIWNSIVGIAKSVWGKISSALSSISALAGKIGGYFQKAYDAVKNKVTDVVDYVKGLGGKILKAVGDLGSLLYNQGKKIITGLINGITSQISKLTKKLNSITNLIPSWKGPIKVDAKLLTPNGQKIMQGLIDGITRATPDLMKTLHGITTSIPLNVASGAQSNSFVTQMNAARTSSAGSAVSDRGPYYLTLDKKVLAEFTIDTITGEPKVISDSSNEGARVKAWAGSGRGGAK